MYKIHNLGWIKHCEQRNPLQDAGRFIQECAEDPLTRVMSASAMVLALCQTAGPAMLSQPPGFVLIHGGDGTVDPIDEVMKTLTGLHRPKPRPDAETFERNRQTMQAMLLTGQHEPAPVRSADLVHGYDLNPASRFSPAATFSSAMSSNFGGGRAGWYADRYDESFGWITDRTGHTILRLDREEDRLALRNDMRQRRDLLINPMGRDHTMRPELKQLSIAGSLPVSQWDEQIVSGVVERAMPVLFLPHTASEPLVTPGDLALDWIGIGLASEAVEANCQPVEAWPRLGGPKLEWTRGRIARLRERLRHFPADYEFFVMRTLRELLPCCERLVTIMAMNRTSADDQLNLLLDFYTMATQGICLGVEALGWHGYGFDSTCDRGQKLRVLNAIRDRGSITKRDLLRNQQWLTAKTRDAILAAFETEGLIMLTDNEVTALPFTDYWRAVIHRAGGSLPETRWKAATGQAASATN